MCTYFLSTKFFWTVFALSILSSPSHWFYIVSLSSGYDIFIFFWVFTCLTSKYFLSCLTPIKHWSLVVYKFIDCECLLSFVVHAYFFHVYPAIVSCLGVWNKIFFPLYVSCKFITHSINDNGIYILLLFNYTIATTFLYLVSSWTAYRWVLFNFYLNIPNSFHDYAIGI